VSKNVICRHFVSWVGLGIQSLTHTWLTAAQLSNDFLMFEAPHLSSSDFTMVTLQQLQQPDFSFLSEVRVVPDSGFSRAQLKTQLPHLDGSARDDDFWKSKT
jgi:hypothetical protein